MNSPYLILDSKKRKETVDKLVDYFTNYCSLNYDSIAFTGMSGAIIAPEVAGRLNKEVILVRKEKNSHSPVMVEGNYDSQNYIILDDLIYTGNTVRFILSQIQNFRFNKMRFWPGIQCKGIFTYVKTDCLYKFIDDIPVVKLDIISL